MVRSDVKKIYDPAHGIEETYFELNELTAPQEAPNTFGIVSVIPNFWETLQLENEYVKATATNSTLKRIFGKNNAFMWVNEF